MAFSNTLASLIVNIVVRTRRANRDIAATKTGLKDTGRSALNTAASLWIMRAAFLVVQQAIGGVIRSTAEFELAIARIESISKDLKGTGFGDSVEDLGLALKNIQVKDIADIALTAVKMGIDGKSAILDFSRVVNQFAVVTDTSAQTTADAFGRIGNVFGILPQDIERVANAILRVDENSVVTAADILKTTEKFAGFATTMGLNVRETVAYVAAMRAVGQTATVTRSSLARLMFKLIGSTAETGQALGLAGKELENFIVLTKTNPGKGLFKFFELFKALSTDAKIGVLKELQLSTVRTSQGLLALAEGFDQVSGNLDAANKGMSENNDLLDRNQAIVETLGSNVKALADSFEAFKRALGEGTFLSGTIKRLTVVVDLLTEAVDAIAELNADANQGQGVDLKSKSSINKRIQELQKERAFRAKRQDESFYSREVRSNIASLLTGLTNKDISNELSKLISALNELNRAPKLDIEKEGGPKSTAAEILEAAKTAMDELNEAGKKAFETLVTNSKRANKEQHESELARRIKDDEELLALANFGRKNDPDKISGFRGLTQAWKDAMTKGRIDKNEQKKIGILEAQKLLLQEIRDKPLANFNNAVGK